MAAVEVRNIALELDERVPTHWNVHGVADGFMPKPWGPFLLPLTMVGLLLFFNVVRFVSPTTAPVERFGRVYSILMNAIAAFLFVLTVAATLAGKGAAVNMTTVVLIAAGALFTVLGNFMGIAGCFRTSGTSSSINGVSMPNRSFACAHARPSSSSKAGRKAQRFA